jgi:hypothetical protein
MLVCWSALVSGASAEVKTPAESVNYVEYTQHEAIARFLSRLDALAAELCVKIVGQTLPHRNYGSKDLFLCILTEEGVDSPEKLNRKKPTFYLVAAKHGNEQSAKEAALWLIRDIAVGELKPLLQQLNILVLPAINPYGNKFDLRRNEQDLDLNRDHVKLESPEVETITRVFRAWMPEITLDVHEKGYGYYQVNTGCVSNVNIHPRLQEFSRGIILAEVAAKLALKDFTFHEYLITQRMGIDSSAGVNYRDPDLAQRRMMRRFSTTDLNDGRNGPGIYETLSFIQEGSSKHDLPSLKERTTYQYYGLRFLAESAAVHGSEIIRVVRDLRSELVARACSYSEDDLVHLRMQYQRDPQQPTLTIKRFVQSSAPVRGALRRDKKAGDVITSADIKPVPYPSEYRLEEQVIENWFPGVEPTLSVPRPLAYIIPAAHSDVIETLLRHGIELLFFSRDAAVDVEAYQTTAVEAAKYDYLPPAKLEVRKKTRQAQIKRGDVYVSCAQAAANLIPCLLEPQSQYGLIRYWRYKLVPEMGDIFPFYRITKEQSLPIIPYRAWGR